VHLNLHIYYVLFLDVGALNRVSHQTQRHLDFSGGFMDTVACLASYDTAACMKSSLACWGPCFSLPSLIYKGIR
jgi:hypothetical protein